MKERPIIFSTPMVQAILEGRKTMTRRILKPQPDAGGLRTTNVPYEDWHGREIKCPFGEIGDRLWVRETWMKLVHYDRSGEYGYKADLNSVPKALKWKPSIYMPRAACRIVLEITNIRAELLQTISINDVEKEGIKPGVMMFIEFSNLWERINGKGSWQKPTYVWVIEFRRVQA